MRRLIWCLALVLCLCGLDYGQAYNAFQQTSFSVAGTATTLNEQTVILFHQISWTGTPTTCQVSIDSSPDGTTWTVGGILAAQTCTAAGNSAVTSGSANFVRVNVSTLSVSSVTITYKGWTVNPSGGGGSSIASSFQLSNSPAPAAPSPLVTPLLTPAGRNTQGWLFNDNTSKWEDFIGINNNTLTGTTSNLDSIQLAIFRPVVLNNTGTQAAIKNATLSINTNFGVTTANGAANQESGLAIHVDDVSSGSAADEEAGGEYAEDYVTNNTNGCSPVLTETCKYSIRAILLDQRTSGTMASGNVGLVGVTGVAFGSATQATPVSGAGYSGLYGIYQNNDAASLSGTVGAGVTGGFASFGGPANGTGYDFHAVAPLNANRFTGGGAFNAGVVIESFQSNANPGNDVSLIGYGTSGITGNGEVYFQGPVYLGGIATSAATIPVDGSLAVTGSVNTVQLATPAQPVLNVVGTGGVATWVYKLAATDGNGKPTGVSATGQINTGNATLSGGNDINVCAGPSNVGSGIDLGVSGYNVYRTTSGGVPATLGLIGTITPAAQQFLAGSSCLLDTGLVGDGSTPPPVNLTGGHTATGPAVSTNTQAQTGGNYTNATATLSTFKSFLVAANENVSFVCDVMWQGSSVTTTLQVGFSGPASPTAFNADVTVTTIAAGTSTNGPVTSLAGTFTGAVAAVANTSYPVHIFGTLENGINPGTLAVQFAAPVATTTVTAVRGSVCYRTP